MTPPPDVNALALPVKLAAAILRPVDRIDDGRLGMGRVAGSDIRALASHPAFRGPVNRAVSRQLALSGHSLGRATIDRLAHSPAARLALLLVCEPPAPVLRAAQLLAGAILHKRISLLVLKRDRLRAQEIIGSDAFDVATHEAPVMYAGLAELDRLPGGTDLLTEDIAAGRVGRAARFGYQALARFVDAAEPELAPLFAARVPAEAELGQRRDVVGDPKPVHLDQILKLARRRLQPWSPIIG